MVCCFCLKNYIIIVASCNPILRFLPKHVGKPINFLFFRIWFTLMQNKIIVIICLQAGQCWVSAYVKQGGRKEGRRLLFSMRVDAKWIELNLKEVQEYIFFFSIIYSLWSYIRSSIMSVLFVFEQLKQVITL